MPFDISASKRRFSWPSSEPKVRPFFSGESVLTTYKKCLPSGRKKGKRWFALVVVTLTGAPPAAGTLDRPPTGSGAKRIVASRSQEPPRPFGASQRACAGPPLAATFLSLPSAKNPMYRLSGDQKG